MIRRPPRSTLDRSSAASDVYKRQREYRILNASMILDFDISILVDNTVVAGELVPTFIRYDGDWDIPFKKRELVRFWLAMKDWKVE